MADDSNQPCGEDSTDERDEDEYRIEGAAEDTTVVTTELIDSPSVSLWKLELQFLVHDGRDEQLFRAGNAGAYVRSLWAEMSNEPVGRATFYEALNEFVQEWTPWAGESASALSNMLSLIGAFTPPGGFTKVAGYLTYGDWSHLKTPPHVGVGVELDLHLKALTTLRSYYRVAPVDESNSAFKTYLRILRQHIARPRYFGFAASQLLALGQIKTDDAAFAEGLQKWPESLKEIVPPLLSPHYRESAPYDLGRIYNYCMPLGSKAFTVFEEVIKSRGGVISRDSQPRVAYRDGHVDDYWEPEPVILLSDGSRIEINLSHDQMIDYVEAREEKGPPQLGAALLTDQGRRVAEFITQYIDTHRYGGHDMSWTPLREELLIRGVELLINREMGLGYIHFTETKQTTPLELPKPTFNALLVIYFNPKQVTFNRVHSKTIRGNA